MQTPAAGVVPSPTSPATAGRAVKGAPAVAAAATQPPVPTPDPQQDAWTILIFLSAAGDLVEAATQDINEMEAAVPAESANVLVQAGGIPGEGQNGDQPSAVRRYKIEADDDPNRVTSLAVAELDAADMDDPASLVDFVAWGADRYPANRYALILVERGGPVLARSDLDRALAQSVEHVGAGRLDVIGFDVALASHLELFHATQPYARFAAASAGLFPEHGWDYDVLFSALNADPEPTGARLASLMAAAAPQLPALAVAVDLQAVPAVTQAVENLVGTLEDGEDLALAARALADARSGAPIVAPAAPKGIVPHPAVHLQRFAAILARRSHHRTTAAAAGELEAAVEAAVIPDEDSGKPDGSRGLALALPNNVGDSAGDRPFGGWHRLLARSYQAAAAATSPPQLSVARAGEGPVNVRQPAYLAAEIAGYDIADLYFVAGRPTGEDRLQLVDQNLLLPEPLPLSGGDVDHRWRAGVHERHLVWETMAPYLTDGEDGNFVVLWPTTYGEGRHAIRGRYRRAGAGAWAEAALIFVEATGEPEAVWSFGEGDAPGALRGWSTRRGDAFQPYDLYLSADGQLDFEPGVTLTLDAGPLLLQRRPLPAGDVRLGVLAETAAGTRVAAFADAAVDNGDEAPDALAYLDPDDGFQFLYPAAWQAPTHRDGMLRAGDAAGETDFTLSRFLDMGDGAARELKAETLGLFGAVDVLYEEPVFVGDDNGLLTAYGYESAEGARTGIFFTFVHEGVGYVVDVDGPTEQEPETIAIVDRLVESWTFRSVGPEQLPGQWRRLEAGPFTLSVPQDVTHELLENRWQRFSGENYFISLRRDASSGATRQDVLDRWLAVAARGVEQFMAADPVPFSLAGRLWARADFEYQGRDEPVRGFIMAGVIGGEEFVAWAEAPAATFEELEASVFLLLLADAMSGIEGAGGLLYATSFDAPDTWGAGAMQGAEAALDDGAYRLTVTAPEGFFWTTAGRSFADGVYEVEATHAAGPADNGFGMIFRADPNAGAFYAFEISSDGFVWIGRCENGCAQMTTLVGDGWFFSEAVRQGQGAVNRLRVEAAGSDLLFFVNGVDVGRARDAVLGEGDIGLFVETRGEGDVGVTFDNFRVTDF